MTTKIIKRHKKYEKLNSRYKILKTINQSSFSIVYLAYDLNVKRKVIVKQIYLKTEFDEKEILSNICLENVPKIIDYFKIKNNRYLILNYIKGKKLSEIKNKLTENEKKSIILKLANIIKSIHKKKIIHRDINPDNIIVDGKGKLYLIDFGISTRNKFKIKNITGTFKFSSKKQMKRKSVDYKDDIYSICKIMKNLGIKKEIAEKGLDYKIKDINDFIINFKKENFNIEDINIKNKTFLFIGSKGSGRSTLINNIKSLLEKYKYKVLYIEDNKGYLIKQNYEDVDIILIKSEKMPKINHVDEIYYIMKQEKKYIKNLEKFTTGVYKKINIILNDYSDYGYKKIDFKKDIKSNFKKIYYLKFTTREEFLKADYKDEVLWNKDKKYKQMLLKIIKDM